MYRSISNVYDWELGLPGCWGNKQLQRHSTQALHYIAFEFTFWHTWVDPYWWSREYTPESDLLLWLATNVSPIFQGLQRLTLRIQPAFLPAFHFLLASVGSHLKRLNLRLDREPGKCLAL